MAEGPPLRIAVCGGAGTAARHVDAAGEVGARLARAGAVLLCGGRGGVMEAAARGAHEAGGLTVGVLPGATPEEANGWISLPLATGMGEMRNMLLVGFSEAVIAIGGEWGTLSEVAYAMRIGRPVVLLEPTLARDLHVPVAESPQRAVEHALKAALEWRAQ